MNFEKEIQELSVKLDALEKLIDFLHTQMNYNTQLFWTIILTLLAATGTALYFIAKQLVKHAINKAMNDLEKHHQELLKKTVPQVETLWQGHMSNPAELRTDKNITEYNQMYITFANGNEQFGCKVYSPNYPFNFGVEKEKICIPTIYGTIKVLLNKQNEIKVECGEIAVRKVIGIKEYVRS